MSEKKTPYETYKKQSWFNQNMIETLIILGGLITINLIFFADVYRETDTLNIEGAAHLGDFVGGFIGSIFTLVSIVLLYSTLKDQRTSSSIEKFETKYFELVKMHRDNVSEMGLKEHLGKKIFVILIREFREILKITLKISKECNQSFEQKELFVISYYALFFGVGPNSSRMLKAALIDYDIDFVNRFEKALNNSETKKSIKENRNLKYVPFEGHQSRLGHYYRHLYQTVCYVDNQTSKIDKYEYVKTIRAQLTTHEQALLFINSLTPIGKVWWDKGLLLRYRFVQNIPYRFFDEETEIEMLKLFPEDYFEWQENNSETKDKLQPS
ncbi:putative phage abortive infection protein [Flavobacterium limnophilum]|uniref:putative phage abortive infection protein n=1 Tax=Flavobacterium limnophilum TaxID=3003262 RepID=UPI0024830CD1|nr:putative phage abortive infection protein [Flavobacterium limnophilum]